MKREIPQNILDALTNVEMPKLVSSSKSKNTLRVADYDIPILHCGTVIVGSGAAGLRAGVELKRRGNNVVIISQSAFGGTSACSGSDKQTLHTANSADRGDNYISLAHAIRAGGAMDEDTAYVEAVGSPRAMASLQYLGLPLPQNTLGGILRYQTDHDEVGRATSCGPRTSRLMVKVLAEEAIRLGIPFYNHTTAVKILVSEGGHSVLGILAMQPKDIQDSNPLGLAVYLSQAIVIAAGGPGELYRDSVYPNGCFGSLGLALDAGIELVNLTESQFGIGTRREGFPWNLSGTYVQAMPHIYSRDSKGGEHHFLADYYRTTQELASNVFRKGYQWPFHATRMLNFGSSLVDLAIHRESQLGRRVFMDFNRNPLPVPGDLPFALDRLDDDVRSYLGNAGADQPMPIDRLRHMNPLSIELYRRYKIDIATQPLEFAVNNQHMNGGIAVDTWGRTNLGGCYAVGEAAGTHGVTRPGGAALNAGQVFGTRVAEHIASADLPSVGEPPRIETIIARGIAQIKKNLNPRSSLTVKSVRANVQARMSDEAGIICTPEGVKDALEGARTLNSHIRRDGIAADRATESARAVQWQHMALASEAVLTALNYYIEQGGGSRGARAICDADGEEVPVIRTGALDKFRFRKQQVRHGAEQIMLRYDGNDFVLRVQPNRQMDEHARSFFERDWPDWLTGTVFE